MKIIFIFIDGFGLGETNKEKNPLYSANAPNILRMLESHLVVPTDASLGVAGLPQSATGQTTILTGENASKVLGRHLHGQPTTTLKKLLYQYSLFKVLKEKGFRVTNANAYRDQYLQQIENPTNRRLRPSASTIACMAAQLPLRTVEDIRSEKAVYHDITNEILVKDGYDVPIIEPKIAAQRLNVIAQDYDLTFFEYFVTDIIGHKQNREKSEQVLEILDEFLGTLDKIIDYEDTVLIITSDHGNIEDLSRKTHTYHKVPTITHGVGAEKFAQGIHDLTDIAPGIIELLLSTNNEVNNFV